MKIGIIGSGYVGLVTGACFADLGNEVICVDSDRRKIELLKKGIVPFYEPGLEELVKHNLKEKRLSFTTQIKTAVRDSLIIFIAVGTPSKPDGEADLTFVENVSREIAKNMRSYRLIVEKSTVPVETGKWIEHTIKIYNRYKVKFDVASNPEFLREGSAIQDFLHPDRIVIGTESKRAKEILSELYKPFKAPILFTNITSAELIKHASNSFLATKISFINALANICEKVGADVLKVAEGMGLDKRIGRAFLEAGIGYGGSCFPKDVDAFIHLSEKLGYEFELLKAVRKINENQRKIFLKKIKDALWIVKGKKIGVLGLSFKPNTDDIRNAPSLEIISALLKEGADIHCFDPQAIPKAKEVLKTKVRYAKDPYKVARNADCLVIVTEWNEFKELDLLRIKKLMRQPVIIDGRNIYEPEELKRLGFRYIGMGRG
ncbi:MAG: UDP-glucose/GDP-mannose dehydrogenase family protein [Candidatus Omnitrophica bacterium]|nr:UDP-glucose/GDP-mannose dehydrogenase family protein [Candidatus Omnitrophota bacterium]MCM8792956.1 UDP-glucose/GDP-mannose dehydrogenase family protein [Candidatus Omnitrophota bacterium]